MCGVPRVVNVGISKQSRDDTSTSDLADSRAHLVGNIDQVAGGIPDQGRRSEKSCVSSGSISSPCDKHDCREKYQTRHEPEE